MPFYRWLVNEEHSIGLADLMRVAPEVQNTLVRLQDVVRHREYILADPNIDAMEKTEKVTLYSFPYMYFYTKMYIPLIRLNSWTWTAALLRIWALTLCYLAMPTLSCAVVAVILR